MTIYTERKVLIVDDDKHSRDTLLEFMEHEGFHTFGVPDGFQATSIVIKELIDLVLLDLNLPGCSGIQVLQEIKYVRSGLPVLMITATPSQDVFINALEAGAFALLPKPIDILMLRQAVHHALFGCD